MNHLAHLALANGDAALMVGGFLGDYVKGRLKDQFPAEIEKGIRLHRAIDRYTDEHPVTRRSAKRLPEKFYRYAGIITDITYDHILATKWSSYYEPGLPQFSDRALRTLLENRIHLPGEAEKTALRMQEVNALAGYTEFVFVERSLGYLSTRLKRANPLKEASKEVVRHQVSLTRDFEEFFPELRDFCAEWIKTH